MRSRPFYVAGLLAVLVLATVAPPATAAPPPQGPYLRGDRVRDKIAGGWIGELVGGAWGRPTEFRYLGRIVPRHRVPHWSVRGANRYTFNGQSDETYIEIPFLDATLRGGPQAGWPEWGAALAASDFPLFYAAQQARENLRAGIGPPLSGDPANNPYSGSVDFQIASDWIGMATPGQPGAAVDLAWRVGHVTNHGDGVYGGVMIAAMHAAAFRASGVREIVEAGRQAVPEGTAYREMIEDVLRWHDLHPRDWRVTWQLLEQRWDAAAPQVINIDAKLNGAYVLLALLYGHGDFAKTIRIAIRAGQDSDCNPSNAASVLGNWLGRSGIPARFRRGISYRRDFPETVYTLGQAIAANYEVARQMTEARNGQIDGDRWTLAPSPVLPAPFEQ